MTDSPFCKLNFRFHIGSSVGISTVSCISNRTFLCICRLPCSFPNALFTIICTYSSFCISGIPTISVKYTISFICSHISSPTIILALVHFFSFNHYDFSFCAVILSQISGIIHSIWTISLKFRYFLFLVIICWWIVAKQNGTDFHNAHQFTTMIS